MIPQKLIFFAGQWFSSSEKAISGYEVSSKICDYYTVKYDFDDSLRDTRALYINDNFRDFVTISVFFTDYEPSTFVYPKMSQPGRSSHLNKLLIFYPLWTYLQYNISFELLLK